MWRAVSFLVVLSSAHAFSPPISSGLRSRSAAPQKSRPALARPSLQLVRMQEDEAAKRAESGKAAIGSTIAGMIAALPFLLLGPGAFTSPAWELQADGLAIMLFLFGATRPFSHFFRSSAVTQAPICARCWQVSSTVMRFAPTTTRCSSRVSWARLS